MNRPDWDSYFLGICEAVATRADCTRRKAAAVIVRQHRIVSTGYNGLPSGLRGCMEGACPRGRHYEMFAYTPSRVEVCGCGNPWPCPDAVDPLSSYDTGPGMCLALHAEQNALLYSSRDENYGATLYVNSEPCMGCFKMIAGSGIVRLVYPNPNGGSPWRLDWPFLTQFRG